MNQKVFILIGRSGCGKGTQAKLISERLKRTAAEAAGGNGDVLYIQCGAEFREFIKGDSVTQQLSAKAYAGGVLQPEFLAVHMWIGALVRGYKGNQHIILDGAPRKFHEAGVLDSIFDFYGLGKPYVINIDVSKEWATARLLGRGRQDDTKGDVESRMAWYEKEVVPTLEFFRTNPKYEFVQVNGERAVAEVFADVAEKAGI
ncbi:MAG: adk, adenylate kinase, adenylate kinase [Candidatus Taylorbacteria bacterium]|nr:adk, adenylate kinase, adenylate kinase [Candidatus Taylorbacteria bacterium]